MYMYFINEDKMTSLQCVKNFCPSFMPQLAESFCVKFFTSLISKTFPLPLFYAMQYMQTVCWYGYIKWAVMQASLWQVFNCEASVRFTPVWGRNSGSPDGTEQFHPLLWLVFFIFVDCHGFKSMVELVIINFITYLSHTFLWHSFARHHCFGSNGTWGS